MKELIRKVRKRIKKVKYLDVKISIILGFVIIIFTIPTLFLSKRGSTILYIQSDSYSSDAPSIDFFEILNVEDIVDEEEITTEVEDDLEVEIEAPTIYNGYISTYINVRSSPEKRDNVVGNIDLNYEVEYIIYDDEWVQIVSGEYKDNYIAQKYIEEEPIGYESKSVDNDVRKSYMDYTAITLKGSQAYKLQHSYAVTSNCGVRVVRDRYCIALGSYYSHNIGQYVDLVLEDGTIIPCIIGDCKADCDTSDNHSVGGDGSVAEFIVSTSSLSDKVRSSGDCSNVEGWSGKVVEVRLYKNRIYL